MQLILDPDFLEDLTHWSQTEPRVLVRILKLLEESAARLSRAPANPSR